MLTNTWTEQLINYSPEKYKKNYASTHSQQINKSLPSGIFLLIEDIHSKLNQREYTTDVFVDLNKAFGTGDDNILLEKLEH